MSTGPTLWAVVYGGVLLSVLKAQKIQVYPKVWGYVGQEEVTLPCQEKDSENVSLVQWTFQTPDGDSVKIAVFSVGNGLTSINEKYTDKVYMNKYSLVIKNVDMADAGDYTCTLSAFPSGTLSEKSLLIVNEQMPLSAGGVSAIVITSILLLGIIAATVYFILFRRHSCRSSPRNHITIETQSSARNPSRPSILKREDMRAEVVYADVEMQPSNQKRVKTADDHVTYAQVKVTRMRPDETIMYSEVMQI